MVERSAHCPVRASVNDNSVVRTGYIGKGMVVTILLPIDDTFMMSCFDGTKSPVSCRNVRECVGMVGGV